MSLISRWFDTTLVYLTDSQNTPEVDLLDSFEAIEIDIPTLSASAEVQIKGSNNSGGTFDLIGQEEPIPSSAGGFRTTVPLGGKYQFIKVYLSAAQIADRVFAVRGVSYASAGLVTLIDRVKNIRVDVGDIEVNTSDIEDGIDELKAIVGTVVASPTENTVLERLKAVETALTAINTLIGAITASPTENTLLERSKAVETALTAINTLIGAISASPTENTMMDRLKEVEDGVDEVKVLIGAVTVSPTENTLLERLKTLETTISLAASDGTDIGNVDVASVVPGVTATNLGKAEDAAHVSGDTGVMALGVRKDKHESFGADGDYAPQQQDKYGGVRLAEWEVGPIELRADNSGWALWEKKSRNAKEVFGTDLNRQFRQGPWAIHMNGGPQAGGEDWASVQIPINEMKLTDLDEIMYTYYKFLAGTEHLGRRAPNIVISVHNPADHDQRADINTRADNSGAVTAGWHETILAATGTPGDLMYWWGDITPTPDTVPTQGTNYTWAQYQADSVFSTYTVYRIQIDYGYWAVTESAGDCWIGSIQINNIPVKMEPTDLNDLGTRKNLTGSPFGEPSLYAARNSSACWARTPPGTIYQKSPNMWCANLYGGVQSNDDWASVVIPVNELPVSLLHDAEWTYYLTNAEVGGVNIVIWVHDPYDFSKRAEITQLLGSVNKAAGFNVERLDPSETEMFYYGEGVANTSITPTAGTQYTWAQFQGDECFNTWTIYRITIDYGWNGPAPTFDDAWVTEISLNEEQIPLKPDSGGTGRIAQRRYTVSDTASHTLSPKTPFRLLSIDCEIATAGTTDESMTITKDSGIDDAYDTLLYSVNTLTGSNTGGAITSLFQKFGYDFNAVDELVMAWGNTEDRELGFTWTYQTVFGGE